MSIKWPDVVFVIATPPRTDMEARWGDGDLFWGAKNEWCGGGWNNYDLCNLEDHEYGQWGPVVDWRSLGAEAYASDHSEI